MSRTVVTPRSVPLRPARARTQAPAIALPGATDFAGLPTVDIAGTSVHLVDERQARTVIATAMHEDLAAPLAVCSVNLDHVHHVAHSGLRVGGAPSVRWLNLIDGAPIAAQVRRMTRVAYPRLAGSDIVGGILDDLAAGGLSVAVLGGSPAATASLQRNLAATWPNLRFAGHWTPTAAELSSAEECERICAELRAARVNMILVCLGKPRQERWISEHAERTGARALLAFGAVVDFLAGRVSRAPRWIVAAHGEWMWRLLLEPRRLARRYLIQGPPAYLAVRASVGSPTEQRPPT